MATKILIPTPLRPYTDKKDAVDAEGATVGELLADLTTKHAGPEGAPLQRAGQAAQLRQRLRQRRRHPVSAEGADAGEGGRHGQHHPVGRGRRADDAEIAPGSRPQPTCTNDEVKRYSRHLIMPEVGVDGQRKLKAGSVLCIGAGGLGSPAAMYLAAAGVGTLGIVDFDVVDFSNLQRQILHGTPDVGRHEAGVGEGPAERDQPERHESRPTRRRCRRRTR